MNNKLQEMESLINFTLSFDYNHDNDREIVIVGCAYLESMLGTILEATFIEDQGTANEILGTGGELSAFLSRAKVLYLLGIIPEIIYKDMKSISKIRNHFAHNVTASFNDDQIISHCKNLAWHKESMMMVPPNGAPPRSLYQVGINQIVSHLSVLPSLQRSKRNTQKN